MSDRSEPVHLLRFGIPALDRLLGKQNSVISDPERQRELKQYYDNHSYGIGLCSISREADAASTPSKTSPAESISVDAISLCIIGTDGVGKSTVAMHMASKYRQDTTVAGEPLPFVIYASTDLTFGRADVSWRSFALNYPDFRIEDPFDFSTRGDREQKLEKLVREHGENALSELSSREIVLDEFVPMQHEFPSRASRTVQFLDLATYTTGDDWGYLNRLVASLPCPKLKQPRHLLIVDAVEGLEVLVGDTDAFGQVRDRRSRVAQLIRTSAAKCHVVLLVENQQSDKRTPEEFVADVVLRLGTERDGDYRRRYIQVEKVRGQTHMRGPHDFSFRNGKGATTGKTVNPDDPKVKHPVSILQSFMADRLDGRKSITSEERYQSYICVFHSLHMLHREIMNEEGAIGSKIDHEDKTLCGFGIEHLDNMLVTAAASPSRRESDCANADQPGPEKTPQRDNVPELLPGDQKGLPNSEPAALIGEDGTYKSKLSKAFLARAQQTSDAYSKGTLMGISVLLTTKTLDAGGLKSRLDEHLELNETVLKRKQDHNVFCRRLEVHYVSSAALFHIIRQMIRRAQWRLYTSLASKPGIDAKEQEALQNWECDSESGEAVRRKFGWMIRFVIDNWTAIRDMYPQVREDPLFLPCLLFFLRREGVSSLIVANEEHEFSQGFHLEHTRRLRDLTFIQIFTWRVPFFGESRVAITVTPPLGNDGRGSVIRELRLLRTRPTQERQNEHIKEDATRRIGVNPSFELYDGLEKGKPRYVPLQVWLYATSPQPGYIDDISYVFDWLLRELGQPENTAQAVRRVAEAAGLHLPEANDDEGFRDNFLRELKEDKSLSITSQGILRIQEPEKYERLREFSELQGVARFPYTLVIQVDEYWAQSNRLQLKAQAHYLNAETSAREFGRTDETSDSNPYGLKEKRVFSYLTEDPFRLFQPSQRDIELRIQKITDKITNNETECRYYVKNEANRRIPWNRRHFFSPNGYELKTLITNQKRHIVKVPYAWDFGFLLMRKETFEPDKMIPVPHIRSGSIEHSGQKVTSWIDFAKWLNNTCMVLNSRNGDTAGDSKTFIPFALAPEAQETLSCVFLEIWISQIESTNAAKARDVFPVSRDGDTSKENLARLIDEYKREAVVAVLVLMTLIESSDIDEDNRYNHVNPKNRIPLAYRSWYSASSRIANRQTTGSDVTHPSHQNEKQTDNDSGEDTLPSATTATADRVSTRPIYFPARLPGTRSVRGDWFLAIARGSRSYQMGERAIDLLCTRRANIVRLQKGVGLPVRDTHDTSASELWTNLQKDTDSDITSASTSATRSDNTKRLMYHELLQIGRDESQTGNPPRFDWLWRSRIRYYDRHARLLRRWLCSVLGPTHSSLRQLVERDANLEPDQQLTSAFNNIRDLADDASGSTVSDNKYADHIELVSRFVGSLKRAVVSSVEDGDE